MSGVVTVAEVLARAADLPAHEAERLLMKASGMSRAGLARGGAIDEQAARRFDELVARRRMGRPLQYLEGTAQFGPVEVMVDDRVLIPRPETEVLWEDAVRSLGTAGPGTVIVDMCTGSGNLALALKQVFPEARVFATDLSEEAIDLAGENASRAGLDVTFLKGDLFDALPRSLMGRIDLLVVNPPYVAESEVVSLPPEVRDHEPRIALVAGPQGDEVLERISEEVYWWLGVGGWFFCEIAEGQSDRARTLFSMLDNEVRPDLTGRLRYLAGRRGASCCL